MILTRNTAFAFAAAFAALAFAVAVAMTFAAVPTYAPENQRRVEHGSLPLARDRYQITRVIKVRKGWLKAAPSTPSRWTLGSVLEVDDTLGGCLGQ
jgi:hypothetical protein